MKLKKLFCTSIALSAMLMAGSILPCTAASTGESKAQDHYVLESTSTTGNQLSVTVSETPFEAPGSTNKQAKKVEYALDVYFAPFEEKAASLNLDFDLYYSKETNEVEIKNESCGWEEVQKPWRIDCDPVERAGKGSGTASIDYLVGGAYEQDKGGQILFTVTADKAGTSRIDLKHDLKQDAQSIKEYNTMVSKGKSSDWRYPLVQAGESEFEFNGAKKLTGKVMEYQSEPYQIQGTIDGNPVDDLFIKQYQYEIKLHSGEEDMGEDMFTVTAIYSPSRKVTQISTNARQKTGHGDLEILHNVHCAGNGTPLSICTSQAAIKNGKVIDNQYLANFTLNSEGEVEFTPLPMIQAELKLEEMD